MSGRYQVTHNEGEPAARVMTAKSSRCCLALLLLVGLAAVLFISNNGDVTSCYGTGKPYEATVDSIGVDKTTTMQVDDFTITWDVKLKQLTVVNVHDDKGKTLFATRPGLAFISAAEVRLVLYIV